MAHINIRKKIKNILFCSAFYNWWRQRKHKRETKDESHLHMVSFCYDILKDRIDIFFNLFKELGARLPSARSGQISVIR